MRSDWSVARPGDVRWWFYILSREHGLDGWRLEFVNGLRRGSCHGDCSPSKKRIRLAVDVLDLRREIVCDLLRHEVAHALDRSYETGLCEADVKINHEVYGNSDQQIGHGISWARIAVRLCERTGLSDDSVERGIKRL